MSDHQLYLAEGVAFAVLSALLAVWLVSRWLSRSSPGLNLWRLLLAAYALRFVAAGALELTSYGGTALRGGDEVDFIAEARWLGGVPLHSSMWLHLLTGHGHVVLFGSGTNLSGT